MFLPSQLPTRLKNLQQNTTNDEQRKRRKMQRIIGRKKKAYDRADEMLAPPASPTIVRPLQQQQQPMNGNTSLMARGWARISGRKRHRRKVPMVEATNHNNNNNSNNFGIFPRESGTMLHTQNDRRGSGFSVESTWPIIGANSNFARVAHLSENIGRSEEDIVEKRHFLNRGMDRIRRSIRRSFRKSNSSGCHQLQSLTQSSATPNDAPGIGTQSSSEGPSSGAGGAKNYCHTDEIAVRSAACSFAVKYLGACEVFESRGMSVCESALQHLRGRKRGTKALLYISGDGIRVVDQENSRGLIVDQTIEKVSFCAPDRNNDKGFSYICRDGATRRWMCHGFHATKDSGERLSHAVGCAFTVCLEKKRKRDAETAAYRNAQALAHTVELDSGIEDSCGGGAEFARTNQAYRSFRQLSMSERRSDPQKAILVDGQAQGMNTTNGATKMSNRHSMPSMSSMATVPSSTMNNASTPRPSGNPNLFERSGSLRAPILSTTAAAAAANADANVVDPQQHYQQQKQQNASSFAHFNSLQPRNEAPAKRFGTMPRMALHNEPIWEGDTEEEIGTNGELDASTNNGGWSFSRGIGNARERFYRTLPYTMPSLVPVNWCTFEQSIPTTIIEEEKQCNPRESPSPADPYHTKVEINQQQFKSTFYSSASAVRADNWLADTLQKAASLSILEKTDEQPKFLVPHSHTFGIGQRVDQQQNWHENAHKISANDTMPKMEANGGDEAKRLRVSPPRVPQSPPVVLASDMVDSGATTAHPAEDAAAIWDRLAALNGGIATGNRKPSRQIEYQLLQETEHPHSPPPMPMMENHQKLNNAVDPFDVNWSQRVLEQSAMKLKSPRPIPPRPERTKRTDNIGTVGQIERIDDQQMPFDQKSDLTKAFDQNNPFSNGKTPPVNMETRQHDRSIFFGEYI